MSGQEESRPGFKEAYDHAASTIKIIQSNVQTRDEAKLFWFEEFTAKFIQYISQASVFVDVGTEYGLYMFLASREMTKTARIHAFEPDPPRFAALQAAVTSDPDLRERIFYSNCAVAGHEGEVTFWKSLYSRSGSIDAAFLSSSFQEEISSFVVPCTTLAAHFADEEIDILKMDIEGAEVFAVPGMKEILAKQRTRIFLEVHPPQIEALLPGGMKVLSDLFSEYGYVAYRCKGLSVQETNFCGGRLYLVPAAMTP